MKDAILNTGVPLTIFPESVWRTFEDEIEWFEVPDPDAWFRKLGWGGEKVECRVGRVNVEVFDIGPPPRSLPPVPTIALFSVGGPDDRILIGLQEGPLSGRRLVIDVDSEDAYLEER